MLSQGAVNQKGVQVSQFDSYWGDWPMLTDVLLLFHLFLARKIPFSELGGIFMEVFEQWNNLLPYPVVSREGSDITGQNANSVERDLVRSAYTDGFPSQDQWVFCYGFRIVWGVWLLRFSKRWY